ncbi:Membrane-bound lytic murein transglycosylase D precursor [Actinomycetales bacterium JB111]|nr:Membrane-bound lytic murein transglycosylase D precursor [Actinomycetales bacterium JB111]
MPAAARAERRGSRRRPFVLATLATTAMGAPTLMAVPSVAAEATTVENLTPTHVSAPAPVRTAPSATFGLAQAANVQHLPARVTPVRQENSSSSYEVRSGDTLIGIAAANGTTVAALRSANGISGSLIFPGQVLSLTGGGSSAAASAPRTEAPGGQHVVVRGDTLIGLARQYDTSVSAIREANGLTGTIIRTGQTLTIPGASGSGSSSAGAPAPASSTPAAGGTYTVQAGDTLSGIAARNGTSVSALTSANSLSSAHRIYVGQRLTLPGAGAPSAPVTSDPGNTSGGVGSEFLGRTYPEAVVGAANANRTALVNAGVPSRTEMQALVRSTAISMGVDPRLALAHAFVESGFNHAAVSPANAIGTMQVIPSSGEWASGLVGRHLNILSPRDNVTAGVSIIRSLQNSAGSLEEGIAAYYQGLAGVRANGMYPDTENYVDTILAAMDRF